jgi:RNA polymerase sigma-70 factor, ECF subfamily
MLTDDDLIKECKAYNQAAQKALYMRFAPKMKGVCMRYAGDQEEVKDILQEGFIKVYSNISSFSGSGSLEGWIRRIMVNTAISYYKKNKKYRFERVEFMEDGQSKEISGEVNFLEESDQEESEFNILLERGFSPEELLKALNALPEPFRMVFNLFYLENNSHKEIAGLLSIDERTSRTRLFRSKKMLQEHLCCLAKDKKEEEREVLKSK